MHIALFHNTPSGGAKRAIYEWVRRLAERHVIDVYTLSSADHTFCDIRPFARQHRVVDFTPQRLFDSPFGRLNQWQRRRDLGELLRIGAAIGDEINRSEYDLVFVHTCLYTHIPTVLQFIEKPTVYYLHEPFGRRFARHFVRPYLKNQPRQKLLNRCDPLIHLYNRRLETIHRNSVRNTTRLLANSHFTQARVKDAFGVDSHISHCGVDAATFHPLPDCEKDGTVFSVGELSPRKGFDFLVESLAQIAPERRPTLKIACNMVNPQERSYVEALAKARGVRLHILTRLNAEQLRLEYNRAQFCVYAPVLEPFGLVPLEAMACGVAVVGVREGGVQESVVHEETGLLVEREPACFAAAIDSLLLKPALAARYGQNGRDHILQRWTWERTVEELEQHLHAVVTDDRMTG